MMADSTLTKHRQYLKELAKSGEETFLFGGYEMVALPGVFFIRTANSGGGREQMVRHLPPPGNGSIFHFSCYNIFCILACM